MSEDAILESIREKLSAKFDIERMVVFGSRATGKAGPDSDRDNLVVVNSTVPFIERQGLAMSAIVAISFPLDLLLYTPEEASREAVVLGSAIYWAEREGKVVYAE